MAPTPKLAKSRGCLSTSIIWCWQWSYTKKISAAKVKCAKMPNKLLKFRLGKLDWKLAELLGPKCCCRQHKGQQWCSQGANTGANIAVLHQPPWWWDHVGLHHFGDTKPGRLADRTAGGADFQRHLSRLEKWSDRLHQRNNFLKHQDDCQVPKLGYIQNPTGLSIEQPAPVNLLQAEQLDSATSRSAFKPQPPP